MSYSYARFKFLKMEDDQDVRNATARSEAQMHREAREHLARINAEVLGRVTLNGVPLTLDELMTLSADELKPFGLRRENLLDAAAQAERVETHRRRAAAASAKAAEAGPLVEALRKWVGQQGAM